MVQTVSLVHDYSCDAEAVWQVCTDFDALAKVMEGLISFDGLPKGRLHQGQKLKVMVSLFGKLPAQPYFMEVVACDEQAMRFASSERGSGVKSWYHVLLVVPTESGCQIQESITIDAGWKTPLFAAWARWMYGRRHPGRLKLLGCG